MKHPKTVEKYDGNLEELARDICNLRYDSFSELLEDLANNLYEDSLADADRDSLKYNGKKRIQLSSKLEDVAKKFDEAKKIMYSIWEICKPYTKE